MNRLRVKTVGRWQTGAAILAAMLALPMSSVFCTASAQSSHPVAARVVQPVRNAERTTLHGTMRYSSLATADLGALPDSTPLAHMILALQPSAEQDRELTDFLASQVNPASPQYHHWLTPAAFGARFGVAQADIQAVTTWLESEGFTVEEIPAGRRIILFSGTVSQLRSAFGTELHRYQLPNNELRIANSLDPAVPTALAPVIAGFVSLSDKLHTASHRDLGTFTLDRQHGTITPLINSTAAPQESRAAATPGTVISPDFTTTIGTGTATYHLVAPYDFATIYNLTPLWNAGIDGTGQTIAIVSRSNLNLNDVAKFRSNFGLPAYKVNKIITGDDPGITSDVPETALDVEWSGAVAKNATIDLVIGGSTLTSDGTDLSAAYIVNNNVAPVISMSYGECELGLGPAGNLFYKTLWQQAAAQGQTAFVSTGDAGATTCDQGGSYATLGLEVNGLASTPYNVAVGGTDLYGTYAAPSTYWSSTNDPATLASALSYVPEVPWNDSCGNPVLLGVLQTKGYTDTTTAQLCADSKVTTSNYRTLAGGGGGVSSCLATTDGTVATCTGGYAKPSWQTGNGVPSDNARDIPDVSLFAGDGLWGSFLPYCVSSLTLGGTCDLTATTNIQGAGGTSFASPAFAGIMALVNQKTASVQGNANPVFYKLAASQNCLDCTVENGSAPSSCVFHDVDLGGNATPCYNYNISKDCTVSAVGKTFGVVSGYAAGKGYDPASGLGSVNVTNLVDSWSSVTASQSSTTTTLALSSNSAAYGSGPTASVTVASTGGTPTGDFSILASGQTGRLDSDLQGKLIAGKGNLALALLPVGTYPVTAHYAGDGTFAESDSAPQVITLSKAVTTLSVIPTRTAVSPTTPSLLAISVTASGAGSPPSGSVTITNTTTGVTLGTYAVQQSASAVLGTANVDVLSTQLQGGVNALTISYLGDSNYSPSTTQQSLTATSPLSLKLDSSSLTLVAASAITSVSTTATVAAATGSVLAYPITLACSGTLPSGASCALSSPVLSSPATTSTVTVTYNPLLASNSMKSLPGNNSTLPVTLFAGLLAVIGLSTRRKHVTSLATVLLFGSILFLPVMGCSSTSTTSAISLQSSASTVAPGTSVSFTSYLSGNGSTNAVTGAVSLNDSYLGTNRTIGKGTVGPGSSVVIPVSALSMGTHVVTATYAGDGTFPSATSSPVTVAVTSTAALRITATDANGQVVSAPLGVTLQ